MATFTGKPQGLLKLPGQHMSKMRLHCLLLLLAAGSVQADDLQVTFGSEYFSWREYDGSSKLLEETGPRYFIGLEAENTQGNDWVYGLRGRLYTGRVDYDGQTMSGTPVTTDTDYSGWSAEFDFTRHFVGTQPSTAVDYWGLKLALGYDMWLRNIRDRGSVYGYEERYDVGYGRLGAVYTTGSGWSMQGGLKLPLFTAEEVGLSRFAGLEDITLKPKPDYSLYASVNYRLDGRWSVGGYFDSYRFKSSDTDSLYGVFYQPKSQQDTIGFYLNYRF